MKRYLILLQAFFFCLMAFGQSQEIEILRQRGYQACWQGLQAAFQPD